MLPLGHIAGIPVEETALSFGPVLLAGGGILGLKLRDRWTRMRHRRRVPRSADPVAERSKIALHRGTTYGVVTVFGESPRGTRSTDNPEDDSWHS
jgi:hypothetical protein